MFHLSVVDHIRLSFATSAAAYQRHAEAASRLDRLSWYTKVALVSLTGLACVLGLIALQRGHGFQVGATIAAACAFVGSAVYVGAGSRTSHLCAPIHGCPILVADREIPRTACRRSRPGARRPGDR